MEQVASARGLVVVDVPHDGNCALHAVVNQLNLRGIASDVTSLRQRAVDYIVSNPRLNDEGFLVRREYGDRSAYLLRQKTNGHWCDEKMMRAVAAVVPINIMILHDSGHVTVIKSDDSLPSQSEEEIQEPFIQIGYVTGLHYVSLRPAGRRGLTTRHITQPKPVRSLVQPMSSPLLATDDSERLYPDYFLYSCNVNVLLFSGWALVSVMRCSRIHV